MNKLAKWNGFSPFYIGWLYGNLTILGGEAKFNKCWEFTCGIREQAYWKLDEIRKLSDEDVQELLAILVRNKALDDELKIQISKLAKQFNIDPCYLHRLPNIKLDAHIKTHTVDGLVAGIKAEIKVTAYHNKLKRKADRKARKAYELENGKVTDDQWQLHKMMDCKFLQPTNMEALLMTLAQGEFNADDLIK